MSERTPIFRPVSSTEVGSGGASPTIRGFSSLNGLEECVLSSAIGGGAEWRSDWGGGRSTPAMADTLARGSGWGTAGGDRGELDPLSSRPRHELPARLHPALAVPHR